MLELSWLQISCHSAYVKQLDFSAERGVHDLGWILAMTVFWPYIALGNIRWVNRLNEWRYQIGQVGWAPVIENLWVLSLLMRWTLKVNEECWSQGPFTHRIVPWLYLNEKSMKSHGFCRSNWRQRSQKKWTWCPKSSSSRSSQPSNDQTQHTSTVSGQQTRSKSSAIFCPPSFGTIGSGIAGFSWSGESKFAGSQGKTISWPVSCTKTLL